MQKTLLIVLMLVLALSLCACGDPVAKVDKMIDAIGAVTVSSGDAITKAENAYADLSAEEQQAVAHYQRLVDARDAYERICNAYLLIEQIGTVTGESGDAITAAEDAYNALSVDERMGVTNAATLTAARSAFMAMPHKVTLTAENFTEYFTLDSEYVTEKDDLSTRYGRIAVGIITGQQAVTLEAMSNVSAVVSITYTVGRPESSKYGAPDVYEDYQQEVELKFSASSGEAEESFRSNLFLSPYYYPTVKITALDVVSVTGSVTVPGI